jgi:hypothetical protein
MDDSGVTVRTRWLVLAGVLVVVAGVVGGVVWVRRARPEAAPVTVVLQAATDPGVDSFVPVASSRPVAPVLPPSGTAAGVTATVDADSGVRVVSGTADRLYAGSTPGNQELYGGSGSLSACDPGAIAAFLGAHPDKAAAWAGVRGIGRDAIAGYLDRLTPVVLVHDTVVPTHGFAGGAAPSFVSVLQAGTAVLVDATGLPVVRCACGNPLSAPPRVDLSSASVQGTRWEGYDPGGAVTVVSGSAVSQFVVVDVVSGQDVTVTAGAAPAPTPSSTEAKVSTPSSTVDAADGSCTLELNWPGVPAIAAWIKPLAGTFTCQEMVDLWRRYEQWPGERGGSLQWVTFDDGWNCTTTLASEPTSAIGGCAQDSDRRFMVYQGPPGSTAKVSATATPAAVATTATTPASSEESTAGVTADLLITPSGNIECARQDGEFACTIKQINGDLGDERCPGERGFIVRLDPTGPPRSSDCRGDFFDGITWPDARPHGTTAKVGDIACDVEETGVTCTSPDGHGFTLARAGYTSF